MYYLREGTDHGHYFVKLEPEYSNIPMTVTSDREQAKEFRTRSSVERYQRIHKRLAHLEIVRDNTKVKDKLRRNGYVTVSKEELIYLQEILSESHFHRLLDDLERRMRIGNLIKKYKSCQ